MPYKDLAKAKAYYTQYRHDHHDRVLEQKRRYRQNNHDKIVKAQRAHYQKHKDEINARQRAKCRSRVLARYGLTVEQFTSMRNLQNDLCALCKRPETIFQQGRTRLLCVDHDHKTGEVRKLLCHSCNSIIGFLEQANLGWGHLLAIATYLNYKDN